MSYLRRRRAKELSQSNLDERRLLPRGGSMTFIAVTSDHVSVHRCGDKRDNDRLTHKNQGMKGSCRVVTTTKATKAMVSRIHIPRRSQTLPCSVRSASLISHPISRLHPMRALPEFPSISLSIFLKCRKMFPCILRRPICLG